jgi:succinate dehydrogenase / fumarate reductase cytochrome b subunit
MHQEKPTSPHLQIYKPQLTSLLSISHRFCGVVLLLGTIFLCIAITIGIMYPQLWDSFYQNIPNWITTLVAIAFSAALIYHWLNGIRHLLWDKLIGLELTSVYRSGYVVIGMFIILMIVLWGVFL